MKGALIFWGIVLYLLSLIIVPSIGMSLEKKLELTPSPMYMWMVITTLLAIIVVLYFYYSNKLGNAEDKFRADYNHSKYTLEREASIKDRELKKRELAVSSQERTYKYELDKKYGELMSELKKKTMLLDFKYESRYHDLEMQRDLAIKQKEEEQKLIEEQRDRLKKLIESKEPFTYSRQLYLDMVEAIFFTEAKYLETKKNPALSTAAEIKGELKKRILKAEGCLREMAYKYQFLLNIFPDLANYLETDEDILSLSNFDNVFDFDENRDVVRDYLSEQEWSQLSTVERNQLAFERWKKSEKSNRVIGLLYEMFVAMHYREKGYSVIEHGIKQGLSDLGRDLIAVSNNNTLIIQCKNWSQKKVLHENVVCQIKGTAMEYEFNHPEETVIPVLVTTTQLSETACYFADKLGVKVVLLPLKDFPMIKCNVNGTNKIYHLPFDQQYWRTEIKNDGELYADNVMDAEKKGFRRAMRHQVR